MRPGPGAVGRNDVSARRTIRGIEEEILELAMETNTLESLPKMLPGSVHVQWVRCGKKACRCQDGHRHGPYYYWYSREGDRVRKRYLKPGQVDEVRARCEARQEYHRTLDESRRLAQAIRARLRDLKTL